VGVSFAVFLRRNTRRAFFFDVLAAFAMVFSGSGLCGAM